jgi:hypothetical protein
MDICYRYRVTNYEATQVGRATPARYNVAPGPAGRFAALTAIAKLTGPFGRAASPERLY